MSITTQTKTGNGKVVLPDLSTIMAQLEALRAENERLKAKGQRPITFKVSEKGALSAYGMGRFPVTLYKQQWLKLLAVSDDIKAFIKDNEDRLTTKE
jgi:hypothetical protein